MANYTETTVAVVLPSENFNQFMSAFQSSKEYHMAKVKPATLDGWFDNTIDYSTNAMNTYYKFDMHCKWTINNLIYPSDVRESAFGHTYTERRISLWNLVKQCGVIKLCIHSIEPGCGIEEMITYEKGDEGLTYASRLMYPEPEFDIDEFPTVIRITSKDDAPELVGKTGEVEKVDDYGLLYGTWGEQAVNPEVDTYEVVDNAEAGD